MLEIAVGSTIAPRAGLSSVDRFEEFAELETDPKLVSRSEFTVGFVGTSFANVMPSAGGGSVIWFCGEPRLSTAGGVLVVERWVW